MENLEKIDKVPKEKGVISETKQLKQKSVKRRIIEISNKLKVAKSGKNTFAHYDYVTPEDIAKTLVPLLEEYNLISIFNMEKLEDNLWKGTLTISDCDTDEKLDYTFIIPFTEVKGASPAQAMGATFTYCKRYILMNIFNIAGDDDLDKVIDGKNVKESKPAVEKITTAGVISKIKEVTDIKKLEEWRGWLNLENGFNEAQKNVLLRTIEEQEKKCQTT